MSNLDVSRILKQNCKIFEVFQVFYDISGSVSVTYIVVVLNRMNRIRGLKDIKYKTEGRMYSRKTA